MWAKQLKLKQNIRQIRHQFVRKYVSGKVELRVRKCATRVGKNF